MESFIFIIVSALVTFILAFFVFKHKINTTELVISLVVGTIVSVGVFNYGSYSKASDTEILNGQVLSKNRERVSCSHSYECNCVTTTDSEGRTSRSCSTCYEHSHDYDWVVNTSVGRLNIDRVDRQGTREPQRFSQVRIGEPASVERSFQNYVKAANYSLFQPNPELAEKYKDNIPPYPRVFDYYRANRVFSMGANISNIKEWNEKLSEILIDLGPKKQANINLFIVDSERFTSDFFYGIQSAWFNGKKNDIIITVGIEKETLKPVWSKVGGWAKYEIFNVTMEQELLNLEKITIENTFPVIKNVTMENFVRLPMAEFEYLKGEIKPSTFFMYVGGILLIAFNAGMSFFFSKHDINLKSFIPRRFSRRRNRR